ncbi:MAG: lactate utilization protein [Planctomycetia bacterium]|nr:lactate utilization protein [Planctomycetia bacterium]
MAVTGNPESRRAILESLRNRLRTMTQELSPDPEPPIPDVWPIGSPGVDEMAERFMASLTAVSGEAVRVPDAAAAAEVVEKYMSETNSSRCTAVRKPLANDVFGRLPGDLRTAWGSEWTPVEMAELPMAIVEAELLLADTGTAVVVSENPQSRMACYLPPVSVVVATVDRLRENMPAAWPEITERVTCPETRGEFVFITGPSRTADIEQILILGVHGPRRLKVILVG